MHVAVEATRLAHEVRGIGRYVRALLPRMLAMRADLRFTLYVRRDADAAPLAASLAALLPADEVPTARITIAPIGAMRGARADLFWFPWNVVRPMPRRGAVVATIHDVAPLAIPDRRWTAWRARLRWRRLFVATVRRAQFVIADSAFTRAEVTRTLGLAPARIRVVPLAADDFAPAPPPNSDALLRRLGVTPPFFLAVGADEPRKNFGLLFQAMEQLHQDGASASLVRAGPGRVVGAAEPVAPPWLRHVGFVADDELGELYRRATALVFPSRYEGFGLPVLEAMQLGAPVICARAASVPEVAGDAAAYVDPDNAGELARALSRMLTDSSWRAGLVRAGHERARRFSWAETARGTLSVFDEAVTAR